MMMTISQYKIYSTVDYIWLFEHTVEKLKITEIMDQMNMLFQQRKQETMIILKISARHLRYIAQLISIKSEKEVYPVEKTRSIAKYLSTHAQQYCYTQSCDQWVYQQ